MLGENCQIESLPFRPLRLFASPHFQTTYPPIFCRGGEPPPSAPYLVSLEDGDKLCCNLSTPPSWKKEDKTIILVHGLGGSEFSHYMVRMSRKCYDLGWRVMRINLRATGPGYSLAKKPYHGGASHEVLSVLQTLKKENPLSPMVLLGYSLGGNIVLKLAGELGEKAQGLLQQTVAICPPIDLHQTVHALLNKGNRLYNLYYVNGLKRHARHWLGKARVKSVIDFDHAVTAPQWGFTDAYDYYRQCSSRDLLPAIRHSCHVIFAEDDPFVDYRVATTQSLSPHVKIWLSQYGGHMGFLGWAGREHGFFWLDRFLLKLASE